MRNNTKNEDNEKSSSYKKTIWLSVIAGILLLVTNSAFWVNQQLFNKDNFSVTVTESITSESSRTAISENITDRIFEDRPIAKRVAGDFSVKIISGLLDTDQFNNVLTSSVERLQVYVTSENQEDVIVELGSVKDIITKLTTVSETLGRDTEIDPGKIPDQIVLIQEEDVPDLYSVAVVMIWLAPLTLLAALILLAYPYYKNFDNKKITLFIHGVVITLVSIVGYLIGPLFRPPVLSQVSVESRTIVGNLYDAFISTFNNQTFSMTMLGLILVMGSSLWIGYPHIKNVLTKIKK